MLQGILLRISVYANYDKSAIVVAILVAVLVPLGLAGASAGEKLFKKLSTKEILSQSSEKRSPMTCIGPNITGPMAR
jgi:hypothetical protein